jgi:predicted CoA-binding protein
MTTEAERIEAFLGADRFAVVGASNNRDKYGSKVFACYLQKDRTAYPVNPREETILGHPAFASLSDLQEPVESVSIITPPAVTEQVVEDAARAGVKHLWMQPGAESTAAIERAQELGLSVIAGGACLLVVLGYRE